MFSENRLNGMAHLMLTVTDLKKSKLFYSKMCEDFFQMTRVWEDDNWIYFVGGRTGLGISQCGKEFQGEKFQQWRCGLHHFCFRATSKDVVDQVKKQ
jgi:catechol 2,3-dioxygenase-like lactoylglutathione lyase family enzyme